MPTVTHPGARLRAWRGARDISLREASRQLHVAHPALKDWEDERQVPLPAFREAIEVWTGGDIKALEWPASLRERETTERAATVRPFVAKADDSGALPVSDDIAPKSA